MGEPVRFGDGTVGSAVAFPRAGGTSPGQWRSNLCPGRKSRFGQAEAGARIDGGLTIKVLIHAGEDGYVVAECPALPGCASQGRTREEALANIREAIEGWLEVQEERGAALSTAGDVEVVEVAV